MDGHSYVTKGYSTFNDAPTHEGGYGYGPKQAVNYYVVETTTIERRHGPAARYTNLGGAPPQSEFVKEYMPKYASNDHYEDYEPNYGSDHEDSSPPGYHERESLMDKFLNKVQIGASRPTKTTNHSSPNKYRPTMSHNYPSEEGHKIKTQNLQASNKYRPTSPNHYYPLEEGHNKKSQNLVVPNKYQPTSPSRSYPSQEGHNITTQNLTSPDKYRTTSPTHKYPSPEGHKITMQNITDPTKYRPSSPTRRYPTEEGHNYKTHNLGGPNKYQPTSPTHNYPSEGGHKFKTQNLLDPNSYRPTNPSHSYPSEEGFKPPNLSSPNKYRPTNTQNLSVPNKYRPSSPTHSYPLEEGRRIKTQNFIGPNNDQPTSPMHSYPSKEGDMIRTSSSPNKYLPSSPRSEGGRYVRTESFPSPNNHWQSVGPPTTHHLLTTPTNDINEALRFLTESVNYSPRSGQRTGWFNNFGFRGQPTAPERRYSRPRFVEASTQDYFGSNTIDSHEAMRKYNGALVP